MLGEKFVRQELDYILHLPLVERVLHVKFRRPLIAILCGIGVMLLSSLLSVSADYVSHESGAPHFVVDAVAYFFHGCGAVPIIRYLEPMVAVLMGE